MQRNFEKENNNIIDIFAVGSWYFVSDSITFLIVGKRLTVERNNNNIEALFALVGAGLWEKNVLLSSFGDIDYNTIYQLSEEQTVTGLVAAGLEHVSDVKVPQEHTLAFVGSTLQLEQQNTSMNRFVATLIDELRKKGVYALLLKGQGIAQCYERPSWRACGDVDLFLSDDNYLKATTVLSARASIIEEEISYKQHRAFFINEWEVELHGSLKGGLWHSLNRTLDEVQKAVICEGNVRSWMNGDSQVFLLREDEDVFYVFAHILQHFFVEGIGLRQICDWCRILWTYKDTLNYGLLESRINDAGVISEWKAFASLAVNYLGMPEDAMPFYSSDKKWERKAQKVMDFIFLMGNFGHNEDKSYVSNSLYLFRKMKSLRGHFNGMRIRFGIFPLDTVRAGMWTMFHSFGTLAKGQ